jgi:ribosomal protein S18 acetylase RimI-like enzyme
MGARSAEYPRAVPEIRAAADGDLDAVFALLTARERAALGTLELDRSQLAQSWGQPSLERWVAVAGRNVVGYASVGSGHELELAADDPRAGDALIVRAEESATTRGFDHLSCIAVREDESLCSLLERRGFETSREVLRMWRLLDGDLPAPEWRDRVAVRTYEDGDAERVRTLLDSEYAAWDTEHVKRPHADWLEWMTAHDEFDRELWFLVECERELIGCALHWRAHNASGWVKDLVVREDHRGGGIGKALLQHGFREYATRGAKRVGLKVDSANPTGALHLYERVGFVVDRRYATWVKPL